MSIQADPAVYFSSPLPPPRVLPAAMSAHHGGAPRSDDSYLAGLLWRPEVRRQAAVLAGFRSSRCQS